MLNIINVNAAYAYWASPFRKKDCLILLQMHLVMVTSISIASSDKIKRIKKIDHNLFYLENI